MSATYYPQRMPRLNLWPILLLAASVTIALCSHALLHRTAPDIAYYCNRNGPSITLRNPATGYKALLCEMGGNQDNWGRIIQDETDANLTAYGGEGGAKDTLSKAIGNLYRGGFRQVVNIRADLVDQVAEILARMP